MNVFTLVHVVISLIAIATGLVVVFGLLTGKPLDRWTAVFLATTVATSATGFGFPADRVLPSHIVGGVSLVLLAAAIYARYARHLAGVWRPVYAASAVSALYLNLFVFVVQAFLRVPALRALAPTQSEPPFQVAQLVLLVIAVLVGVAATIRFRRAPGAVAHA
jgi:hypothetical protein